mmetsp:Transcript_46428/g.129190  ORF Transcript_46428/g.129190 Transcript_46428/m.129190 type:complete len:932 (-) Transcript_46428:17-2812(-)
MALAPGCNVMVLADEAENREPSPEEIREYAEYLGIDYDNEPHLLWIAKEGVVAPVPHPWKACTENHEDVFYFNFETAESVWDHPCDEIYRKKTIEYREKYEMEALSKSSGDPSAAGKAVAMEANGKGPVADGKRDEQQLRVTVLKASGVKQTFKEDSTGCICEVRQGDGTGALTCFKTEASHKNVEPVWNETHKLQWSLGEPLVFVLYDKARASEIEGRVVVDSTKFYPGGFDGELPIADLPGATLAIRILPDGVTTARNTGKESKAALEPLSDIPPPEMCVVPNAALVGGIGTILEEEISEDELLPAEEASEDNDESGVSAGPDVSGNAGLGGLTRQKHSNAQHRDASALANPLSPSGSYTDGSGLDEDLQSEKEVAPEVQQASAATGQQGRPVERPQLDLITSEISDESAASDASAPRSPRLSRGGSTAGVCAAAASWGLFAKQLLARRADSTRASAKASLDPLKGSSQEETESTLASAGGSLEPLKGSKQEEPDQKDTLDDIEEDEGSAASVNGRRSRSDDAATEERSGSWECGDAPAGTLRILVVSAKDLVGADQKKSGKPDTYCVCELEGKPSKFQTPVANQSADPVWYHAGELVDFVPGDVVALSVFEKGSGVADDELLGRSSLAVEAQHLGGRRTEVNLVAVPGRCRRAGFGAGFVGKPSVEIEVSSVSPRDMPQSADAPDAVAQALEPLQEDDADVALEHRPLGTPAASRLPTTTIPGVSTFSSNTGSGYSSCSTRDRGLAGVGLATPRSFADIGKGESPDDDVDEADGSQMSASCSASNSGARPPLQPTTGAGVLKPSTERLNGISGKNASSNHSEVSEELSSEFDVTSPALSQLGGQSGRGTPLGDTLEFSASATGDEGLLAVASAAQRHQQNAKSSTAYTPAARWRRAEKHVQSLSRSLRMLKTIREQQQEYLRLLLNGT